MAAFEVGGLAQVQFQGACQRRRRQAEPMLCALHILLQRRRRRAVGHGAHRLADDELRVDEAQGQVITAAEHGTHSFGEALTYFPELEDYNTGPGSYVELVAEAKRTLSIPVIASLNGSSPGGWVRYATLLEEAGADALELNVYAVEADAALLPGAGSVVEAETDAEAATGTPALAPAATRTVRAKEAEAPAASVGAEHVTGPVPPGAGPEQVNPPVAEAETNVVPEGTAVAKEGATASEGPLFVTVAE